MKPNEPRREPRLKPKFLAVGMNQTAHPGILTKRPNFDWKSFRHEVLFWGLIVASVPSFGYLLFRIVTRINLP